MAVSTTQSIWRSGGGDQTRTAYCGTGLMVAQFYVADSSVASSTKVKVSSASGAANLILPANAIITSITTTTAGAGAGKTFDMGFTVYSTGVNTAAGLINEGTADAIATVVVGSATAGASLGVAMSTTDFVYITAGAGGTAPASGVLAGFITYFVVDPYTGQQNV